MQTLRDYQERAVEAIFNSWKDHASAMAVLATGLGKTTIFTEVIRRSMPKRALVLAHREELIWQARERCEQFGMDVDIEMGEYQASARWWSQRPVVISTIQTQVAGNNGKGRMALFPPEEYDILVVDECFVAGTLVDGRPIELVNVGESVWTWNHDYARLEVGKVTHVFKKPAPQLLRVVLFSGGPVVCTPNHPFFNGHGYEEAARLCPFKTIYVRTEYGIGPRVIKSVTPEWGTDATEVYNLEVKGNNNYFANGILVHNCHHATAKSYRKVLDYYRQNPNLKVLLVTATPDRADKEALGQIADTVAFEFGILDGINEGWLTLVDQQSVTIEGLDFSHIKTTAGDLNGAELAAVMEMEKPLHEIASTTIDAIGNRKGIVFTVSVAQAEQLCEIFNRHRSGMAGFVCGKTPKDERKEVLRQFEHGDTQLVVNCGILTEGFDAPTCEVIVMARPTKSRSLYAQMLGRGLRPLPGIVGSQATAKERRDAIANSPKKAMLVLDFVGVTGRHKLVSTVDILGGKVSEAARERATAKINKSGKQLRLNDVLKESESEIKAEIEKKRLEAAARKARIKAKAIYHLSNVDAFDQYDRRPSGSRGSGFEKPLSDAQRSFLLKRGKNPDKMTPSEGRKYIGGVMGNGATEGQCRVLCRFNYDPTGMSKKDASVLIDQIKQNGWKRVEVEV